MIRPVPFLLVVFLGLTMLTAWIWWFHQDPYAHLSHSCRKNIDHLNPGDLAEAKLVHAENNPRFKVGIFGSSRSLNVKAEDIYLRENEFFNFSVPAQSVLNSGLMLSRLLIMEKAPEIILISFDHPFLNYLPFPLPLFIPKKEGVGPFWEWMKIYLTINVLSNVVVTILPGHCAATSGYYADGSLRSVVLDSKRPPEVDDSHFIPPPMPWDMRTIDQTLTFYLATPFQQLLRRGHRIILFESILSEQLSARLDALPNKDGLLVRKLLKKFSRIWGAEYVEAPRHLPPTPEVGNWREHPPREVLAPYLIDILVGQGAQGNDLQ